MEEEVTEYPIVDPATREFTPKALKIFNDWFDFYKDPNCDIEAITPESAVRFIKGVTNERVSPTENRITGLFTAYNKAKDNKMTREEFLTFYLEAARDRPSRVYENLKTAFIRCDLKKMSEVTEDLAFKTEQMPRHTMSSN